MLGREERREVPVENGSGVPISAVSGSSDCVRERGHKRWNEGESLT